MAPAARKTTDAFSNYWWIPIAVPLVGGVLGILLYDYFIGDVLSSRLLKNPPSETPPAPPETPIPPARPAPVEETVQPAVQRDDDIHHRM